jgi:hypothetical protein
VKNEICELFSLAYCEAGHTHTSFDLCALGTLPHRQLTVQNIKVTSIARSPDLAQIVVHCLLWQKGLNASIVIVHDGRFTQGAYLENLPFFKGRL